MLRIRFLYPRPGQWPAAVPIDRQIGRLCRAGTRLSGCFAGGCFAAALAVLVIAPAAVGQETPAVGQEVTAGSDGDAQPQQERQRREGRRGSGQRGSEQQGEPEVSSQHAAELIRSLGAATFAERERAMGDILRLGGAMAPHLRQAIEEQEDPELVLRATITLDQMTEDDLDARIEAFLAGGPQSSEQARQWFAGWATVEELLGDSPGVRELFVQIVKVHPEIAQSLDATTAERTAAAERVAVSVQMGMLERRQEPTLADGVAMLLPLTDPGVQIGAGYEATLMRTFNGLVGKLRSDAPLWEPVSRLLEIWVLRSRMENRGEALWYAMQWELPAVAELGRRTLKDTTGVDTLQTAMQAIARFGKVEDAAAVAKFLDDDRVADTRMPVMVNDQPLKVTLADAALVTIAILYQVSPEELGMSPAVLHPRVGFMIDHAGYTAEQADQRAAAIEKARRWVAGDPPRPRRPS